MIKVIVERRVKKGCDLAPLLQELRIAAIMHYQGFVSAETLVDTQDSSIIVTASNWQSLEHWERWATSQTRADLYQQMKPFSLEKTRVRTF